MHGTWVLSHFSCVQLFVTLWTVTHQALLSMGFSRQECWSGWSCPPPGSSWPRDLVHWQASSLPLAPPGKPLMHGFLLLFSHSVVSPSLQPHGPTHRGSLSFTISQSLLKLMSIEFVIPSNHLVLCLPLLLLPSIFPSIRVSSNELALCIRWPKYWSFSVSISPSNEYSGLISFGIDWFDLLAFQGTLKSLLQHHSSKALILQYSAFFMVQL